MMTIRLGLCQDLVKLTNITQSLVLVNCVDVYDIREMLVST